MTAARKTGAVIAIDGPAGAGKSTLARRLARALDLAYVNTGAMYRAVAREALRGAVDPRDAESLARIAAGIGFGLGGEDPPSVLIEGRPPAEDLASPEVEAVVSLVAQHPPVREVLREEQRRLGAGGAVVEGRDIGTVVFPDADVKLFLSAAPDERAARRQDERGAADPALAEALSRRDALDERTNPFVPADDALALESTGREPDEVFGVALDMIRSKLAGTRDG